MSTSCTNRKMQVTLYISRVQIQLRMYIQAKEKSSLLLAAYNVES